MIDQRPIVYRKGNGNKSRLQLRQPREIGAEQFDESNGLIDVLSLPMRETRPFKLFATSRRRSSLFQDYRATIETVQG